LDAFNAILYPFIEGQSGLERNLSDQDWVTFGRVLKAIHTTTLPPELADRIPHESYSPQWRDMVKQFQAQVEVESFADPSAASLARLMKDKRAEISHLIQRAEDLGAVLQSQPANLVLCHSDIHVGNILMNTVDKLYIVDWDQPILAPKERDLMFIGAGIDGRGDYADQDEHLFYEGYGQTAVDPVALAYYRYERIVQDVAAYCQQLLLTDAGGDDRPEGLRQITSQFRPGAVIDMAYRTEKLLPSELRSTPK
jgi:spectinomycin phosphotransferase